jgi:Tol biopolymer transport system component
MSQIAFVSSFDGDNDIYIMNSDGNNIKKITDNNFDDFDITWLKDGKTLLFTTNQNSIFSLYSIELNNTNQNAIKLLADNIFYAYKYELSPDGRSIVYTGYNSMSLSLETIYSMNIDGSNKIQLTSPDLNAGSPHWGVDGNTIYFENKVSIPRLTRSYWGDSNSMLAPQIMSMNRDGSNIKTLTNSGAVDSILRISPDGQYIMFRSDRDKPDEFRTYIMNTNGENQTALVNEQASWWPYFNKIVVFPDNPTLQPYFIDLNGNFLSELPEILKNGYRVLPDKKHVYVYGDNGETFSLCVASIPLDLIP